MTLAETEALLAARDLLLTDTGLAALTIAVAQGPAVPQELLR